MDWIRHKLTLTLLKLAAKATVWGDSWDYIMGAITCEKRMHKGDRE